MKKYIGTLHQYNNKDELIGIHTGEIAEILNSIPKGWLYYYRFSTLTNEGRKREKYNHFGLSGFDINGHYYSLADSVTRYLNQQIRSFYKQSRENKDCFIRFDNYVNIYAMLLHAEDKLKRNTTKGFHSRLDSYLLRHPEFVQVYDLNDYKGVCGIYILVLDKYNVCYLGQTQRSFTSRIKQHWSRGDYFGRGIDRFKAMDTTRIYLYPLENPNDINQAEYTLVPDFPEQYTLNCGSSGGDVYFMENNPKLENIEPDKGFNKSMTPYWRIAEEALGISRK